MNYIHVPSADDWPRVFAFLQVQPVPPGGLEVTVREARRTNAQNRYLWGVVYATLAQHMTETRNCKPVSPEDVHFLCRKYFLPQVAIPGTDETRPMSTTELTRSEGFSDYLEQLYQLGAKMGCYIPGPNE